MEKQAGSIPEKKEKTIEYRFSGLPRAIVKTIDVETDEVTHEKK